MVKLRSCVCGYIVSHPLIYCPSCGRRLKTVDLSREDWVKRVRDYQKKTGKHPAGRDAHEFDEDTGKRKKRKKRRKKK